jgi:hypothetical protein
MKSVRSFLWDLRRFGITPQHILERVTPPDVPAILLISQPKSGTHLLEKALCEHPLVYRPIIPTITRANVEKLGGLSSIFSKLKGGQIAVTHLPYSDEMLGEIRKFKIRHVFIYRDPRDVVLSAISYILKEKKHFRHSLFLEKTKEERIRLMIEGDTSLGIKPITLEGYRERSGWLSSNGLSVSYESLIGPKGGGSRDEQIQTLEKVFDYLSLKFTQDSIAQIADRMFSTSSPTFNKGTVARWTKEIPENYQHIMLESGKDVFSQYGYVK